MAAAAVPKALLCRGKETILYTFTAITRGSKSKAAAVAESKKTKKYDGPSRTKLTKTVNNTSMHLLLLGSVFYSLHYNILQNETTSTIES